MFSLWFTNTLVRKIAEEERNRIRIWANAIQRKAELVNYTENFFDEIRKEERERVEIWAKANRKLINATNEEDLTFYLDIVSGNDNIPVVLTDQNDSIETTANVDFSADTVDVLKGALKKEFTLYDPIRDNYGQIIYYKESKLYTKLRKVLDDLIQSFFNDVVNNYSSSSPVIIMDSDKNEIKAWGNIDDDKIDDKEYMDNLINEMKSENDPITIELAYEGKQYIYYKDSALLKQLRFYPLVQFAIIGLFLFVAYVLFSIARRSEQNQVWVGLAKETAHQLGTPLSSMMAWLELLRVKEVEPEIVNELYKDMERLDVITDRFSKIGSESKLVYQDIVPIIEDTIDYMKKRTSRKIQYTVNKPEGKEVNASVNKHLFTWVIENLSKNAIDAIDHSGEIVIDIFESKSQAFVDVSDTGKGLPKSKFKTVFNPGYTSKDRGWGLGLSLAKRIIKDYHNGKIFVKNSIPGKGTTFRIVLNK
ncbi:MAG: HAMP domain-containing histidine kinase [Bacteroidales bacterium]|nr:HAMP domain-containing histidine kinase [Bacteroidales bacterium]MCF8327827.1 HAMP domain-containing histidine kinase [Bacteroidales bacterium]